MKNSLDPKKTRAILIGTSEFVDFNNIAPVKNNLTELEKVLANKNIFGLLPDKNIKVVKEPTDQELRRELIQYTKTAKKEGIQTLIVYFAGHGFRTRDGKYYLATKNSEKELIRFDGSTALAYDTVKKIINASQIPQTIIFIDACYSGAAAQGEGEKAFNEYVAKGTYTLTAADSTELAWYDTDAEHTIFTGELLNIFKNGLPSIEQEKASLSELYTELRTAVKKKRPDMSPQQLASKEITGDNFLFFKNKNFINPDTEKIKKIEEEINWSNDLISEKQYKRAERILKDLLNEDVKELKHKTSITNKINKKLEDCKFLPRYYDFFENLYKNQNQDKIDELNKQIIQLQTQKTENEQKLQNKIDKEKQNYETLLTTKKQIEKQLKDSEKELENTVKKEIYNKLEQEYNTINSNIKQKVKEIADFNKQLNEKQIIIDQLKKEIEKYKTELYKLKNPPKPKIEKPNNRNFTQKIGNTTFDMVYVKGGIFKMGGNEDDSEKPIHDVTIPDFYMAEFEVTQKLWREVMGSDPEKLYFNGKDNNPVENVSWNDAQKFITKLNQKTGKNYRLPSEAEWEYAAGGGENDRTKYAGTNNDLSNYAWYDKNSYDLDKNHENYGTNPVGQKTKNQLGIYDMSGNVWEWCQDKWHKNYKNAPKDGTAWETGNSSYRVMRGGSWNYDAYNCRVAYRNSGSADDRGDGMGFRIALSL